MLSVVETHDVMRSTQWTRNKPSSATRSKRKGFGYAAFLLTASVALGACSGGSDSASNGEIDGVQKSSSPSTSSTPSNAGAERPEIATPGFKTTFEGWNSDNPRKQEVLNDGRERMRSLLSLITSKNPDSALLSFYSKGRALVTGKDWVKGFQEKGLTLTGESRYFGPKVQMKGKDAAILEYCNDENKGFTKSKETGETNRDTSASDVYTLYRTKLDRQDDGVWKTSYTQSIEGKCGP